MKTKAQRASVLQRTAASIAKRISCVQAGAANTGRHLREPRKLASTLLYVALPVSLLVLPVAARAQSAMFPEPVVASSTKTIGTGLNQPQGVGVDSSGDVFVASANNGNFLEFPANGGTSITLASGLSYPKGAAVDSLGNAYTTSYGGTIYQVVAGGGAGSAKSFASGSTCPDFGAMGYYIGFYDLSADAQGNIYAIGGQKYILEFDQSGNCTERLTPTQLTTAPSVIAADPAGDIYYAIGNTIYFSALGGTTSTTVSIPSGSVSSVGGLTVDSNGDLFISDANTIDEVPMVNGALQTAGITYVVPSGAPFNIGISATGVLYYPNFNANTVVRTVIGSMALGSSAVGTAGTAGTLTYTFNAAVTPAAFAYVSGSGATSQFATVTGTGTTCAATTAYPASTASTPSSCTLSVAMTAGTPGAVSGAVLLQTSASTLATTYLFGTGQGAALAVNPGTQTSLGTFTSPSAVAEDGTGDVFVADDSTNTVTEVPAGGGTPVTVGTGFNAPQGLAVDAAGDLFVSDTGNDRIVEVPIVAGALSTAGQTVVASASSTPAVSSPLGLAVDTYGDVLVANSGAGNVLELPNQGGVVGSLPGFVIGTGFQKPTAIAVDASDNIFVGDATAGKVFELTPIGAQSTAVANYSQIAGLAVDANDDIFLTQTGIATVTKVPFTAGSYATNSTVALGVGFTGPEGITLDTAGDLYLADPVGSAAYEIQRTLGALGFGRVNFGETSAVQSLLLSNSGNQPLTFGSTLFTESGSSSEFTVTTASNNGCSSSLATGTSCGISASFSPTVTGPLTATVTFQSNAANAAAIAATLSGTGTNSAPTTLTLSSSPAGTANFGQTVTVTATVAPQTASSTALTGNVQFSVDGVAYGTPAPLGTNGTATEAVTGLPGGQHSINATYSGDDSFASSAAASPLSLLIATAPTTTTLTTTIAGTTASPSGTSVTFTVTVSPNGLSVPPYPSGTVSFSVPGSTTPLGTAPLTNGAATFTTTALPNGQYNVTATYSGDTDFSTSTSTGYAVYVSPPTFLLLNAPSSISAAATGSGSATFSLMPIAGYTGTVFLACSGLPKDAVCNFTPGAVDFTVTPGTQTVQLTVNTGATPALAGVLAFPSILGLAGLLCFWRKRGAPRMMTMVLVLVLSAAASMALSGCGNGANNASPGGSSNVTVTLTGTPGVTNAISQTFMFSLQVK